MESSGILVSHTGPRWFVSSVLRAAARISPIWWMLYDAIVAVIALKLAYDYAPKAIHKQVFSLQLYFFPLLVIISGNISTLYDRDILIRFPKILFSLMMMIILSTIALTLFTNLVIYEKVGRYVLATTSGIIFILSGGLRFAGYVVARYFKIRVLVVGSKDMTSSLASKFEDNNGHYSFVGFCGDETVPSHESLGGVLDIPRVCQKHRVNLIIITDQYMRESHVLDQCFKTIQSGCSLMDECTFFEYAFEIVLVDKIDPSWFYAGRLGLHKDFQSLVKRGMDIFIGVAGLILTAPLCPLIWLLIRLTSWGPAFYSQERCGQFGRPFKIHKFRTMSMDAENNGAQWAKKGDNRVTPVGFFLRMLRLDEIPQFWNILKGDMSFVGPRPERPELVSEIEKEVPFFSFRHWAKPGLTGLAQIRYRYGASIDDAKEKLQHDLYYIKNWSLLLDFQIILRTLSAIMKGSR